MLYVHIYEYLCMLLYIFVYLQNTYLLCIYGELYMLACAFAPRIVLTNSVRKPDLTASVAIKAKTANEMPISDIHVIADMPPSDLLDRR